MSFFHFAVAESEAALLGEDPTTDLDQGANPEGGPGPGPEEADGVTDQGADQAGEVDQARDTGFMLVVSSSSIMIMWQIVCEGN